MRVQSPARQLYTNCQNVIVISRTMFESLNRYKVAYSVTYYNQRNYCIIVTYNCGVEFIFQVMGKYPISQMTQLYPFGCACAHLAHEIQSESIATHQGLVALSSPCLLSPQE